MKIINLKLQITKLELVILLAVILTAAFFRFYQLDSYMTFLGDEGRDMLIIKDLLQNWNLPFIGPASSVGNVYLGPLYYYLMGLTGLIFGLNPVAMAGTVALIGTATVFLVYYLGRLFFDKWSGLIAAWVYAISPVTIIYSKSSWNPNPAPFFTLLSILFFWRWSKSFSWRWLALTGLSVSAAVQMHYLTLPLIPIFLGLMGYKLFQQGRHLSYFIKPIFLFLLSINFLLLPWWLFEVKHQFVNISGIWLIFFGEKASVGGGVNVVEKFLNTVTNVLAGNYLTGGILLLSLGMLGILGWLGWARRRDWQYQFLGTVLVVGLVFINLYKGSVYDHYVGYLAPVLYLLLGSGIMMLGKLGRWGWLGGLGVVLILTLVNLQNSPLKYPGNNQLKRTQDISKYVLEKAEGKPFNFALIANNNYDSAYQFYFSEYNQLPKTVPMDKTDQLFVVCEDVECTPINHPKYEIAAFGMSKVESVSEFQGVKVFKLVANPSGKPT